MCVDKFTYCQECDECTYIGEGDYACMLEEPKIVLTEHIFPTEDFGWCNTKDSIDAEYEKVMKEAEEEKRKKERRKQRGKIKKRGTGTKTAQTKQSKQNQLLYK